MRIRSSKINLERHFIFFLNRILGKSQFCRLVELKKAKNCRRPIFAQVKKNCRLNEIPCKLPPCFSNKLPLLEYFNLSTKPQLLVTNTWVPATQLLRNSALDINCPAHWRGQFLHKYIQYWFIMMKSFDSQSHNAGKPYFYWKFEYLFWLILCKNTNFYKVHKCPKIMLQIYIS